MSNSSVNFPENSERRREEEIRKKIMSPSEINLWASAMLIVLVPYGFIQMVGLIQEIMNFQP